MEKTLLKAYTPYSWKIESIALSFYIEAESTKVVSMMHITNTSKADYIFLNGEQLELIELKVNGLELVAFKTSAPVSKAMLMKHQCILTPDGLWINTFKNKLSLIITTKIYPDKNLSLKGLYRSSDMLCTQCEAEGFRRITFYPDRPDVLSIFTTSICAPIALYKNLLSNGNLISTTEHLIGNQKYQKVVWHDPHPKPCYLFALVAGNLNKKVISHKTSSGKKIAIHMYTEDRFATMTSFAITALKQAIDWDEKRYKRKYDLALFQIVAVSHFNMGAMENKGLNIFNANTVVADALTASDADISRIKTVVAHEYFHNWTGNRITCRDWFQLSLKEGLTVFRENQFSEEVAPVGTERIEQVEMLRSYQFNEDASPLAHAVRPDQYQEIDNLYTATVYEKGAEIIRMIQTYLGDKKFNQGMQRYFKDCDGKAVTIEQFLASLTKGSGISVQSFLQWYVTPGTPQVSIQSQKSKDAKYYQLTIEQHQKPLPIPVAITLYANGTLFKEVTTLVTKPKQVIKIPIKKNQSIIPAFFKGLSAPVRYSYPYTAQELQVLATRGDPCVRRDAMQILYQNAFLDGAHQAELEKVISELVHEAMAKKTQWGLVAYLLQPTDLVTLLTRAKQSIDPLQLYDAREEVLLHIAKNLESVFSKLYEATLTIKAKKFSAQAIKSRSLTGTCLAFMMRADINTTAKKALMLFQESNAMSNQLAALAVLNRAPQRMERKIAFGQFEQQFGANPLLMQKWLRLQTSSLAFNPSVDFNSLEKHPSFDATNPNCLYALYAGFQYANFKIFHTQVGYQAIIAKAIALDAQNPQVASAILKQGMIISTLSEKYQHQLKSLVASLSKGKTLSPNTKDIISTLYGVTH
ncbi:MAG: aminopeptidase N [Methylacidiphilales bacterium]|nr:aminopeptidase N [Candidatus Methylacidiphilales bacterium]